MTAPESCKIVIIPVRHVLQIGRVDEGIVYSSWSPDEEILAICTSAHQVVLMSKVHRLLSLDKDRRCSAAVS